jgi:hypothetical protein
MAVAEGVSLKAELEKLKDELANVTAGKKLLHSNNKALSHLNRSIAAERDSLLEERDTLLAEQEALKAELTSLKSSYDLFVEENSTLSAAIQQNLQCAEVFQPLSQSLHPFGGFQKVTDKGNIDFAIGAALLSMLAVLMRHTQPVTRLRTVVEAVFGQKIFGAELTTTVLCEMYKKFSFNEQRSVFAPWKVLRAIDLSSVGGLKYNGLETLRNVEPLSRY